MKPRRRTVSAWLAVTVLLAGVTGYLGWLSGSVGAGPPPTSQPIEVTAPVDMVKLVDRTQLACTVTRATVATLSQARAEGVVSAIIDPSPEDPAVRAGELLAEVDGSPVVVVEGKVPMFRDITVGDHGQDVDAVRATLALLGQVSAKDSGSPWEKAEQNAWHQHLSALGYPTIDKKSVSKSSVLVARSLPAVPAWPDNALGSTDLDAVVLKGQSRSVTCPVPVDLPDITSSHKVSIEGQPDIELNLEPDVPVSAASDDLAEGGEGAGAGDTAASQPSRSVSFAAPDLELGESSPVVVSVVHKGANRAHLAVPVTALWTDAQGRTAVRTGGPDQRDVVVTPGLSAGGMVEVTPVGAGRLSTVDEVVVGLTRTAGEPDGQST